MTGFDFNYKLTKCSCPVSQNYVPESLEFCKTHYVPPIARYISCECFGNNDGTDGGCHWCLEMTPYQWNMCADAQSVRCAMQNCKLSYEDAIKSVEANKNRHSE